MKQTLDKLSALSSICVHNTMKESVVYSKEDTIVYDVYLEFLKLFKGRDMEHICFKHYASIQYDNINFTISYKRPWTSHPPLNPLQLQIGMSINELEETWMGYATENIDRNLYKWVKRAVTSYTTYIGKIYPYIIPTGKN